MHRKLCSRWQRSSDLLIEQEICQGLRKGRGPIALISGAYWCAHHDDEGWARRGECSASVDRQNQSLWARKVPVLPARTIQLEIEAETSHANIFNFQPRHLARLG